MREKIINHIFENYTFKNNEIRKNGTRKVLSNADLIKMLGSYSDDNDLEWSKSDRDQAISDWISKINNLAQAPRNDIVVDFISSVFKENDIAILQNQTYTQNGIRINDNDVYIILDASMYDWNRENPESKISAPELKAKLVSMSRNTSFQYKVKLTNALKYDVTKVADMNKWLRNTYSALQIVEEYEIFETMVKHWVWMVKRKMMSMSTKNQFVLNFFGKPACGKSFFVKLMTSPIEKFRHNNSDLNNITDERTLPSLGNNFIHFLDELSTGTAKTISSDQELAKLKNIITADTEFTYRPMGTNADCKVLPSTSLIAASNFHVFDVILDSSGMRRWFELNVGLDSNKYDTDKFDHLRATILDLWIGVDENIDNGYWNVFNDIGKKVCKIQDSYVRKDSFDLWLGSIEIVEGKINGKDAHDLYTQYCAVEGFEHKAKRIQSFYARLAALGVETKMHHGYTHLTKNIIQKSNTIPKNDGLVRHSPSETNRIEVTEFKPSAKKVSTAGIE
jgi:hypothetical protein